MSYSELDCRRKVQAESAIFCFYPSPNFPSHCKYCTVIYDYVSYDYMTKAF